MWPEPKHKPLPRFSIGDMQPQGVLIIKNVMHQLDNWRREGKLNVPGKLYELAATCVNVSNRTASRAKASKPIGPRRPRKCARQSEQDREIATTTARKDEFDAAVAWSYQSAFVSLHAQSDKSFEQLWNTLEEQTYGFMNVLHVLGICNCPERAGQV